MELCTEMFCACACNVASLLLFNLLQRLRLRGLQIAFPILLVQCRVILRQFAATQGSSADNGSSEDSLLLQLALSAVQVRHHDHAGNSFCHARPAGRQTYSCGGTIIQPLDTTVAL